MTTQLHSGRISIALKDGAGFAGMEINAATATEMVEWLTPFWAYLLDMAAQEAPPRPRAGAVTRAVLHRDATAVCKACGTTFPVSAHARCKPRWCSDPCRRSSWSARRGVEPDWCQCRHNLVPSPFHCLCGRWKPSGQPLCDHCAAAGLVAA